MSNYSETFYEAVEQLNKSLSAQKLQIGVYGKALTDVAIKEYSIEPLDKSGDEVLWSTLRLKVKYSYPFLGERGVIKEQEEDKTFIFLCPACDSGIPDIMLEKLWGRMVNGVMVVDQPDTVAVEEKTGAVYFVYLRGSKVKLTSIGMLSQNQVELIPLINQAYPFCFQIEPKTLYNFVVGEVGWAEVRRHMLIEFKTEYPFILEVDITKELEL